MELQIVTVSEVAEQLGVRPRDISDLFYARKLDANRCPIKNGRRLIPRAYVRRIEAVLQEAGVLPSAVG